MANSYKKPDFPIYIIAGNGHFTVLFSRENPSDFDAAQDGVFYMEYYDGLSIENTYTRLTIGKLHSSLKWQL